MKIFKQSWFWLLVGVVVFLINQLPFLTDMRPVMYDEAWYANTAYNFSQGDGFMNTIVGTRGNSNFLLPTLTGVMFWIFGYSLFTIRLTAVLCGVVTMIFLHLCLKELKCSVKAEIAVLAFFVSIALYNTIFRFGRPECASVMCMTGGVWFFLRYLRDNTWGNIIGMACFTFLSAIAHPYALLFFALDGVVLLYMFLREKQWKNLFHLSVLLVAAIAAIGSIAWVSYVYNGAGEDYVSSRFSMSNIVEALPIYIKDAFLSKHAIYMIPLLIVAMISCWNKNASVRIVSSVTIAYAVLFPFLFSTDLMMVGLGLDYVAILATLLVGPFFDQYANKKIILPILFGLYCVVNLGISYYFNYVSKYEKCNSILQNELKAIIPQDAIIFTPIRQYPMVMKNPCNSDHSWKGMCESFDYIILNSQDKDIYENSIRIQTQLEDYELIYERDTKQYGVVQVFERVRELENKRVRI